MFARAAFILEILRSHMAAGFPSGWVYSTEWTTPSAFFASKKHGRIQLCAFSPGRSLSARLCPYLGLFGEGPPRVVISDGSSAHVVFFICVRLLAARRASFLMQPGPVVCNLSWRVMRFAAGHRYMPPGL
jgi:hypothetical protein